MEKVLKKVDEGVEIFDDIWEKVYSASQQSLKEKYEGDLKKEIKKLQRLRDQIKTWVGSNDIKDKTALVEARKLIETKMEQFKVCEKETKTKAYSKEGLARDDRNDPREAEKDEKRQWIQSSLERLQEQVEAVEAEIERAGSVSTKGKAKGRSDVMEKLDNKVSKHKWHIDHLEQILQYLDDDLLEPNLIESIKENVEFYIESAVDDDGATGVEDEINIYEELHQEAESVAAGQGSTQVAEPDAVEEEEPEPVKPVATAAVAAAENKSDDASKKAAAAKKPAAAATIPAIAQIGVKGAAAASAVPALAAAKTTPIAAAAPAATAVGAKGAKATVAPVVAAPAKGVPAPVAAAKPAAVDVVKAGVAADKKTPGTTATQVLQMGADAKKGAKATEPAAKEVKADPPATVWGGGNPVVAKAAAAAAATQQPAAPAPAAVPTPAAPSTTVPVPEPVKPAAVVPSAAAAPSAPVAQATVPAATAVQPAVAAATAAATPATAPVAATAPAAPRLSAADQAAAVQKALKMSMFFTPPGAEFDNKPS